MELDFRLAIICLLCCFFPVTITYWESQCIDNTPFDIPCKYHEYRYDYDIQGREIECCHDDNKIICYNSCPGRDMVLVGRETNECYPNGTWRFPFPECIEKVSCPGIDPKSGTICTTKGCFTHCEPGYRLSGKYNQSCAWLKTHHKGYADYPKCIPNYLDTLCSMEQHGYCLNHSKTKCYKETEVPICTRSGPSGPICECVDQNVRGICTNYERLLCRGMEIDCYPGENGYTGPRTCGLKKVLPSDPTCGCEIKKKLPCKELYRDDRNRHCSIPVSGYGIHCVFYCGPGERLNDPWKQVGHRLCRPDGSWNYPLDVRCIKE